MTKPSAARGVKRTQATGGTRPEHRPGVGRPRSVNGAGVGGRSSRSRAAGELEGDAIALVAARLRVFADPNRIRLMGMLNEREASVTELADRLVTTHQNVSHHLVLLHRAGVVSRRKDGNAVRYSLSDWSGWWLIEQIAAVVVEHLDNQQDLFRSSAHQA